MTLPIRYSVVLGHEYVVQIEMVEKQVSSCDALLRLEVDPPVVGQQCGSLGSQTGDKDHQVGRGGRRDCTGVVRHTI